MTENTFLLKNNLLFAPSLSRDRDDELHLLKNFCGDVITEKSKLIERLASTNTAQQCLVFLTGNLHDIADDVKDNIFCVIKQYSTDYEQLLSNNRFRLVELGEVPINIHNVGVQFRRFFTQEKNYFKLIESQHEFQFLTESNKAAVALRKGIYLTKVEKLQQNNINNDDDALSFRLLRCSSNLEGPTDNLRATDCEVLRDVNAITPFFFEQQVELNHVLAQIYYNHKNSNDEGSATQHKATIKRHSDKTKDMPKNALMAFVTFYDFSTMNEQPTSTSHSSAKGDAFDLCFRHKTSILTTLEFVLKDAQRYPHLEPKFRVVMYPNSVFLMSLEMNRLYTHEICPSSLPIDRIPTRMGYVIRCAKTEAVFRSGQTRIIVEVNNEHALEPMTPAEMSRIKELYRQENLTTDHIVYENIFTSLNNGDYRKPIL